MRVMPKEEFKSLKVGDKIYYCYFGPAIIKVTKGPYVAKDGQLTIEAENIDNPEDQYEIVCGSYCHMQKLASK